MKLSNLLLIGAIAFGLAACNNENVPEVQTKDATMSLRIMQTGISSPIKAVGVAKDLVVSESAIDSLDVFVFNGDVRDGYKREVATKGTILNKVEDISVTAGSRSIIVVANSPLDLSKTTSKKALLDFVHPNLLVQASTSILLMTSEETAPIEILPGVNYYGYPDSQADAAAEFSIGSPLQLTRVAARVALMGVTVNFEAPYENWTYKNESVFLFNAKMQSKFFGPSLVLGEELLSGLNLTNFGGPLKPYKWDAAWTVDYLKDAVTDLTKITRDAPVYYYTFENDSVKVPTCISLQGKLLDANGDQVTRTTHSQFPNINDIVDADGYTYYTVVVNAEKINYTYTAGYTPDGTIKRNTQYNITLAITRPGVDDPTDPVEYAILNVEVEVTPWVIVEQGVTW